MMPNDMTAAVKGNQVCYTKDSPQVHKERICIIDTNNNGTVGDRGDTATRQMIPSAYTVNSKPGEVKPMSLGKSTAQVAKWYLPNAGKRGGKQAAKAVQELSSGHLAVAEGKGVLAQWHFRNANREADQAVNPSKVGDVIITEHDATYGQTKGHLNGLRVAHREHDAQAFTSNLAALKRMWPGTAHGFDRDFIKAHGDEIETKGIETFYYAMRVANAIHGNGSSKADVMRVLQGAVKLADTMGRSDLYAYWKTDIKGPFGQIAKAVATSSAPHAVGGQE